MPEPIREADMKSNRVAVQARTIPQYNNNVTKQRSSNNEAKQNSERMHAILVIIVFIL
jgi:hypothetical protein